MSLINIRMSVAGVNIDSFVAVIDVESLPGTHLRHMKDLSGHQTL